MLLPTDPISKGILHAYMLRLRDEANIARPKVTPTWAATPALAKQLTQRI